MMAAIKFGLAFAAICYMLELIIKDAIVRAIRETRGDEKRGA